MAVAGQRFYRGDALRLGSRKQFYGVCVKPIEILRIISATNKNFHFLVEKQVDPVKYNARVPLSATNGAKGNWRSDVGSSPIASTKYK